MGVSRVCFIGLITLSLTVSMFVNSAFAFEIIIFNPELLKDLPWLANQDIIIVDAPALIKEKSVSENQQNTRPTFGLDHENYQRIIDDGFMVNDNSFQIDDNFHTPFAEQIINIGEVNSFQTKIYADKGLKIQEFLFGVPKVGDAHLAEVAIEIWLGHIGEIQQVKAIQKSNTIDEETLVATHEKTKCKSTDTEENCDLVKVSVVFLEPLKDKVMALKAIDFKNRYQITYLNEGMNISGDSLNPMKTKMIPSGIKGGGLMKVTQISKYSPFWISEDKRIFEKNDFDSFKEISYQFERFHDEGDVRTRNHSGFGEILDYEKKRATQIFDASLLISETPEIFAYEFPENRQRMNEEVKQEMMEQEKLAQEILEEYYVQARWY